MERHRRYINWGCKHLSCNKKFSPIERDKRREPAKVYFSLYIYYNIIFYGCQAGCGSWVMAFKARRITIRDLIIGVEDLGWAAHTPSFPSFPTLPVFTVSPLSQFHSFRQLSLSFRTFIISLSLLFPLFFFNSL